ncbi:MAG: hypothetical protein WCJ99_17745 [Betaproteobacteria bacterium]
MLQVHADTRTEMVTNISRVRVCPESIMMKRGCTEFVYLGYAPVLAFRGEHRLVRMFK